MRRSSARLRSNECIPELACAPDKPTGNRPPCGNSQAQQCWLVPYAPHAKVVACRGLRRSSNDSSAGSLLIGRFRTAAITIAYYTNRNYLLYQIDVSKVRGVNSGDQ